MPFSISETELVMTSSPSYASELASITNVNVIGTDNRAWLQHFLALHSATITITKGRSDEL